MKTRSISLAVLAATVASLGLVPAAQAQIRISPNHQLDSDDNPFRGRDQVALAVNPADPQHVVEVNANYLDLTCESSVSTDGGESWSDAVRLVPPAPSPMEFPFTPSCATFQTIEFGSGQNVYAVATSARSGVSFGDSGVLLFKSSNGGATWQPGVVAMPGGPGGAAFPTPGPSYSRPTLSVHAGAAGGADRVYIAAQETSGVDNSVPPCPTGVRCVPVKTTVSNNGGASFGPVVQASPLGADTTDGPSKPVVNADGSVTVAWRTFSVSALLQAARSTDAGQAWGAPVDIANVVNTGTPVTTHVRPAPPAPSGASASASYPRMASDRTRGRIYLVYSQGSGGPNPPPGGYQGSDHFISPDSAVWFQRSLNNGATWSQPTRISDPTSYEGSRTHQTRHPTVSVAPSGRINIAWHDRRHWYQGRGERNCTHSHIFCEDIRLGDTYYSYSDDGGTTFSPDIRVNDRSHNNEVGYDTRPSGYWNYGPQSVAIGPNKTLIGWMDSREGNWDTDTEDIYLATVDLAATGDAPRTHIDEPDAVSRSVALSKLAYMGGNEGALIGGPRDPAGAGPTGPASRNASSVVIVNENDVPGALAGQVLARANPGPVLLSGAGGLPDSVKAEVSRMTPARAFVIGSTASLSAQVVSDVASASGIAADQITRVSGANDAATAAAIATQLDQRLPAETTGSLPAFDAAVIANPASPDAAAVGGLAAARRLPILWVSTNAIPAETQAALTALNIDRTLVVGGPGVVSPTVLGALPSATRLGGTNQYQTSAAVVAESKARGLPSNVVYVADGTQPMDAALLSGVVARATGTLVLASGPLYETAAGQAAEAGLTGISRLIVVGPASAAPPPPPPAAPPPPSPEAPPAPPPPPPPAAGDTTAPIARLSGALFQKLGPTVVVTVSCTSEPCRATANATIRAPKIGRTKAKTFKLRSVSARLSKGAKRKFALRISTTTRLRLLRALRLRKGIAASFTITVADEAGNKRSLKRTVRLKLPPKRTVRPKR